VDHAELNELRSIEELTNKQGQVKAEITAINEEYQGLPLPEEARERYAQLVETNEEIDARVTELDKREKYIRHISENGGSDPARVTPAWEPPKVERTSLKERDIYDLSNVRFNPDDPGSGRQEYRDRAMRAIELAHFPDQPGALPRQQVQEHIARLLDEYDTDDGQLARRILKTGSPQYRAAFRKWMSGVPMTNEEQRAFSLGTTGIPITFTLDPTLIPVSASVVNPLRAISNVESIVGANEWRGTTAAAITASRAAEGAVTTDNTPTLAQPAIVCSRVQAFVPFSVEAEGDWPGMDAGLARLFADAKDDEEATAFFSGNGTPPNPFGLSTGVTGTTALATGLTVTAANLYAIEAALAPRFRPRAQWVANRAVYNIIRALDTAGGAQLWLRIGELMGNAPASSGGNGNTGLRLLGYAVNELSTAPATIVNGIKDIFLGDFSMFKIIDRVGMNVELVQTLTQQAVAGAGFGFPTGQRGLFAWWRNGSKVLDAVAFRAGTGTT
jgi:HK97 family phage major capsid protein